MTRRVFVPALLAAAATLAAAAPPAQAGLIPVTVSVVPDGTNYKWTYSIVLPSDTMLKAGDYFTVYDFAGLLPDSANVPEGWAFSTNNTGVTPPRVIPEDSPALPNLTWIYTGPTIDAGSLSLPSFSAVSKYGDSVDGYLTSITHRTSDGKEIQSVTPVAVPNVPEPTTLALAGLGLPLVFGRRLFAKKA